jgi:hypothetical protein
MTSLSPGDRRACHRTEFFDQFDVLGLTSSLKPCSKKPEKWVVAYAYVAPQRMLDAFRVRPPDGS